MDKGDITLVTFPFTNLSNSKLRPAIVLLETNLDVTVCFITTQTKWKESTDILLFPSLANGLKKESLIKTNKIATLDKSLVKGLLGKLSAIELTEIGRASCRERV